MLLFSQRKSEERGYNYRSNTSSGSNEGSKEPTAPCPLPGCTLDISPSFLGLRSALCVFIPISFLPFVCQSSISRDKKGKLEPNTNKLKLHVAWSGLSLGDNSNGKEKEKKKKTFQVIGLFKQTAGNIYSSWNSTVTWNKTVFGKACKTKGQFTGWHVHWGPSVFWPDQGLCFLAPLANFCPRPTGDLWGSRSNCLGDPPGLFPSNNLEGSQRVESRAVTRWWLCSLHHRTGA